MRSSQNQVLSVLARLLSLVCLLVLTKQQQPLQQPIIKLGLMQSYSSSQPANTYQYYQLSFSVTKKLLLITLDMNTSASVSIFISTHYNDSNDVYYDHPNETTYTQECDQSSFDTCIVRFDDQDAAKPKEVTVYFSVYTYADAGYQLYAIVDDIYNLNFTVKYRIDFSKYESGVLRLSGDQLAGMEEGVMVLSYNTSGQAGKFMALASIDEIPNSASCCRQTYWGVTVGAFNKILKLKPIDVNSSYFILIEGEKGTKFNLHFFDSTPSSPNIDINSTVIYYTHDNLTYLAHTNFAHQQLPLFIKMNAFSGYGVFNVSYCNGYINSTFQNINGENGEIGISPAERLQCRNRMGGGSFGLLIENIQVQIANVHSGFGYEVGIYEGTYNFPLRVNQQKFGIFLYNETKRTYPIEIIYFQQLIALAYQQITQASQPLLLFQLEECYKRYGLTRCKILTTNQGNVSGTIGFIPQPNHSYNLKISCSSCSNSTDRVEYLVQLYNKNAKSTTLVPYKLYLQDVEENQYKFYVINLTQIADEQKLVIANLSLLTIRVRQINGDVYTLTSFTIPQPTYEKYVSNNYTNLINFSWNGNINYLVNQSDQLIYVSVKGNMESLYSLQFSVDVDADIPAKYMKIMDGTQNNFLLNKTSPYQLISFSSHILPYKIYITNKPKCIKMGYTLPLDQTCLTEIPSIFSEKVVYFNISNGNSSANFKFSIYVNSGEFVLDDRDSILIGCPDRCYEVVTVQLSQNSNVIHEGRGQIYEIRNQNNLAQNSFLPLKCDSYPCSVKINATLPYGGEMTLFLQSMGVRQIRWTTTPITFGDYPKKFIFPLRPWSQVNSILIYSEALQLDVYYNIVNIHETEVNIKSYKFPLPSNCERSQKGNPLRKVQVVTIDDDLIVSKGCRGANSYCLAVFSLYPNLEVEYNEDYFNSGIGYISSNTYQYYFPLNMPYMMNEQFSMSYFAHKLSSTEVVSNQGYRISLQPLSNCHPKLYIAPADINPTFQKPRYDDALVNYTNGWINFTVLAEDYCKYRVSLTNSIYETITQNKFYHFALDGKNLVVVFRSQFSRSLGFKIQVTTESVYDRVNSIAVNRVNESIGFIEPTPQNSDFKTINTPILKVPQNSSYDLYIISISANCSNIQVIIKKDEPVILTRNQQDKQTLKAEHILSYKIFSTGSIALFVTTSEQYATVTVNKNNNQTQVKKTVITRRSQPWIYINTTSGELTTYDVTIRNSGNESTVISILFQLNDVLSYKRLYQGIITYDAFVTKQQKNCYYFQTPLIVGRKSAVIDIVIGKNNSEFIEVCQGDPEGCAKLFYVAFTKSGVVQSSIKVIQSIPRAYRVILSFIPRQNYTICFYTPSITAVNVEYYVLLNDLSMQHLFQDYTLLQTRWSEYDMYEIVEEGYNENIMIEVTSCQNTDQNKKILVGSSSFIDSSMGRYTDLLEYYKTESSIYAKLGVGEGYYYLGVKNAMYTDDFSNAYTIRFQNITNGGPLLASKWELQDSKIVKIYGNNEENSTYTFQLPQLVSTDDSHPQKGLSLTYTVVIQKVLNQSRWYVPLDVNLRCPNYLQALQESSIKQEAVPVISASVTFNYSDVNQYKYEPKTPRFNFQSSDLPREFNISGRINVVVDSQNFTFYYENTQVSLSNLSKSGISPVLISFIVIIVVLLTGLGVYVLWAYIKMRRQRKKVSFEMSNFGGQQKTVEKKPPQEEVIVQQKKSVGKGYGQLVDELN